jgi:hypothetical protein
VCNKTHRGGLGLGILEGGEHVSAYAWMHVGGSVGQRRGSFRSGAKQRGVPVTSHAWTVVCSLLPRVKMGKKKNAKKSLNESVVAH